MEILIIITVCMVIFPAIQWHIKRDILLCERRREERMREVLESYRANTIPGRRPTCADTADTIIGMTPEEKRAACTEPTDSAGR